MTTKVEPHKSSLGMEANIAVLIAYLGGVVIGWIPVIGYVAFLVPLVVFVLEKESKFVRFHAMQSLTLSLLGLALGLLVSLIAAAIAPTIFYSPGAALGTLGLLTALGTIVSIIILIVAIIAVVNGYQYKEYKIPLLGGIAVKLAGSGDKMFHNKSE